MNFVTYGLIGSFSLLFCFSTVLFYERTHRRIADSFRKRLDFLVIKVAYIFHTFIRTVWKNYLQQIFHYGFHTILKRILLLFQKGEDGIRVVMRVNKTLAKQAEKESAQRSMLEEIALHKAESALSEVEKIKHKQNILEHGL